MNIVDWILFVLFALCVCYLLLYAIASKFYRVPEFPEARTLRRFVILFPAYKEDRVIVSSVRSFLRQEYPKEMFDIIVISDQMQSATNELLRSLPIRLLIADYKDSSKAKALTMAMDAIDGIPYDVVVIMDADNLTSPHFLTAVNRAFDSGVRCIQAHRTGQNLNTDISVLDGISEEINNGIFRSGHNALGLSAALSGSGMAFEADWFRKNVRLLETAGASSWQWSDAAASPAVEEGLFGRMVGICMNGTYLEMPIYDEKTQKEEAISNQRKRWIAAQFGILRSSLSGLQKAIRQGNIDYCDKIIQWMLPPRLIQIAGVFGLTFIFTAIGIWLSLKGDSGNEWMIAIKWWILSIAQIVAMILPIPGNLLNKRLGKAIIKIPILALTTIGNLFKLKGAYKKFIHTEHGEGHF